MKKYKEYRMFIISILLLVIVTGLLIYSVLSKNTIRIIASVVFLVVALGLLIGGFKIILDDTYMVNFEWKIAAMLPIMIDYKDIKEVNRISKHKVQIIYTRKTYVYISDSDDFINELNERLKKIAK